MPPVARRRDRAPETAGRGVSWGNRRSGAHRANLQGDAAARKAHPVLACAARDGDGPPFLDPAGARRRRARAGDEALHRGPESAGQAHPRVGLTSSTCDRGLIATPRAGPIAWALVRHVTVRNAGARPRTPFIVALTTRATAMNAPSRGRDREKSSWRRPAPGLPGRASSW